MLFQVPSFVFTEEYQAEFLHEYHTVFDVYRKSFLAGEMVWNFADFMTDESKSLYISSDLHRVLLNPLKELTP